MTIAGLAAAALSSALLYRAWLRHSVAERRAIHTPNGIDSLSAVRIGGINQWIQARGENVNNPILLFIHGGPGIAFTPLAGSFQGPWEKYFTVVQWDQRGAGRTYGSNDPELQRRTMTIPQMQEDAFEVASYLRRRFRRDRIFVAGHSWGSVLGLWLAHEHPECMYAYVGVGQVINVQENELVAYRDALQQARSSHRNQAIKDLENSAPDAGGHFDPEKEGVARGWEAELLGPPAGPQSFTDVKRLLRDLISAPDYSLADDLSFIRGQSLSMQVLLPQMAKVNLNQLGYDFRVPVFFFEGRQDPYCRPSLVADYARHIRGPHTEMVWFDNAGHFPFFEERQKFTRELISHLLPLAH